MSARSLASTPCRRRTRPGSDLGIATKADAIVMKPLASQSNRSYLVISMKSPTRRMRNEPEQEAMSVEYLLVSFPEDRDVLRRRLS
jgi:hypothetical protein